MNLKGVFSHNNYLLFAQKLAAVDQAKAAMQATAVNAKAESPEMALPGAKSDKQ